MNTTTPFAFPVGATAADVEAAVVANHGDLGVLDAALVRIDAAIAKREAKQANCTPNGMNAMYLAKWRALRAHVVSERAALLGAKAKAAKPKATKTTAKAAPAQAPVAQAAQPVPQGNVSQRMAELTQALLSKTITFEEYTTSADVLLNAA